ncbi:NAD(P)-binding protein [Coniophora puteana RWD-64-598 SS2]|uniref:NAD(P)-binding protein n=1 Tax=Coniophora puteana (strain RWD-64-598) TaxID=741705 RepID=A0A5M3MTT6_CONPW|nr:NAD(P)-binding protein [Coniophora puteana RWD-64-598 SS2]EIW82457.1 NAD(P)-binding protein [Coniophora puteana RWD-64-598 SS2]
MSNSRTWPIIIVTGANSGVGFGICQRLLVELSQTYPDDAQPSYGFHNQQGADEKFAACEGLTLILACRSRQRAETARDQLFKFLDDHLEKRCRIGTLNSHATAFRKNLEIDIHTIDLASVHSIFLFADEVSQKYPYISHLVFNAGLACFSRINWSAAIQQLACDWVNAVTAPAFYVQDVGKLTPDHLGLVWQCNVFGHYVLFRLLEKTLAKCSNPTGPRVLWMSSHESDSTFYDPQDWQLIKSAHSYQCSKYQIDMMSLHLDRQAVEMHSADSQSPVIRHFTVLPGVAGTNIASSLLGPLSSIGMFLAFYIARVLGSPYHLISSYKAAVSAVHLCLVPFVFLPMINLKATSTNGHANGSPSEAGVRYVSQCNRWGKEGVSSSKLYESKEEEVQTNELIEKCETLFRTFCEAEGRKTVA